MLKTVFVFLFGALVGGLIIWKFPNNESTDQSAEQKHKHRLKHQEASAWNWVPNILRLPLSNKMFRRNALSGVHRATAPPAKVDDCAAPLGQSRRSPSREPVSKRSTRAPG